MKARMEKYSNSSTVKSRASKNENLYSEIGNMNIDYVNIDVDNAVELNPTSSGKTSREDYQKQRELNKILPSARETIDKQETYVEPKEERVYDINEILSMARKNKLFEDTEKKRLINTEYNILTKLDVGALENEEMKKEDLKSLIDDIYEKEMPKSKPKKYSRSEEARLLNDLFEDEPEEEVKLVEDSSKDILDKGESQEESKDEQEVVATQIITTDDGSITETTTMYDFDIDNKSKKKKAKENNSVNMLKDVDLKKVKEESITDEEYEETEGKGLIIAIIFVVILILLACGFFVYEYFFGV